MEDHLADALARADALSAMAGGGSPPQLPSPLLESLPLPSAVLGPEYRRLDQIYACIDPKFLDFGSDDDEMGRGSDTPPPPPTPSTVGASGAAPPNPAVVWVSPDAPHPQDGSRLGVVLSSEEFERMLAATPPPPAPYTDGAPGASLWNPDTTRVSIDTLDPQDVRFSGHILDLSCILVHSV